MIPRLGVNIDHVATLREARGEDYPSVVDAASVCFKEGADQITIHLREDRRHIQDTDVEAIRLVTKKYGRPLNLEMGCDEEIIDVARAIKPDWVCLVPEKRQERTTEGGLDLINDENFKRIKESINALKSSSPELNISLFLEANLDVLKRARELDIEAVEIHTGDFARAFLNSEDITPYLEGFKKASAFLQEANIACHAGHGLTGESVVPLLQSGYFVEYNIGHWIICQSVFDGLGNVVSELKKSFQKYGEL